MHLLSENDEDEYGEKREATIAQMRMEREPILQPLTLGLFGLAFLARLAFILFLSDGLENTGWYLDSYHHWQIAYFTKEMGLFHGPRLWDLGGMEYFWGPLPPLVGALTLFLTQTTSILPIRVENALFASTSIALLYILGSRYFNRGVGVGLALLCAINPVFIAADTAGVEEPLGIMLLLWGLYLFDSQWFLSGVFLALAGMCRAEFGLYGLGIVGLSLIVDRNTYRFTPLLSGWALAMAPYIWHLWRQTGNPVYPLYWNFMGNVRGVWIIPRPLTPHETLVQHFSRAMLALALIGIAWVILKRLKGYAFLFTLLSALTLISYMHGFSSYMQAYLDRNFFDRLMLLDHLLASLAVSVLIFYLIAPRTGRFRPAAYLLFLLPFAATFLLWEPVLYWHEPWGEVYVAQHQLAEEIKESVPEGVILVPGDAVYITYSLVREGVGADRLLSALYHPEADQMLEWLKKKNVTGILVPKLLFDELDSELTRFYLGVVEDNSSAFEQIFEESGFRLYRVIG